MKIVMVGTGYVGLVSGACFSDFGFNVVCVDKREDKIESLNAGEIPIYEPGLDDLVARNVEAGRLSFTTSLSEAMQDANVVFIAVGTPTVKAGGRRGAGHADLSYVYAAAEEIADNMSGYTVVVDKSTVPVGTGRKVTEIIKNKNPEAMFDVVSNPEFLREGSAIDDFKRPDRVVIGAETEASQNVMRELYRPLYLNETPIVFTALETAEMIKYAANAFLATKITFINEIADLCEKVGANVQEVAKGIGLDKRIGGKFLHAGPGYGGSCFPKDTLAIIQTAQEMGTPLKIVETVAQANADRKKAMANRVIEACDGDIKGKKIAVLGLAFKPNTDDMRDSPALDIVPALRAAGAEVCGYDPESMEEAKKILTDMTYCQDAYEAMQDADAVVIVTEWNQFRSLDKERMKQLLKSPIIVDLRNIYPPKEMLSAGFKYTSIGRPIKEGQDEEALRKIA
jgi:UDPglucose 6-dehydrogenase